MTRRGTLGIAVVVAGLWLPAACEQILPTGKVGNTINAPSPDGTCAAGLTVCGKGAFAQCLDLQNDHEHCGDCDNACALGIVCAAGTCQQVACTGPVTVSVETVPEATSPTGTALGGGALLADINGDGRPDLIAWEQRWDPTEMFQVALGAAGGGFDAAVTYQAANRVNQVMAADWNSDGFDDLFVSTMSDPPCLQIWLGHADGKLTSTTDAGDAGCVRPVALADLNGDGNLDMVAYGDGSMPGVFLADANGAFHVRTSLPIKHNGLAFLVRDWNGDGFPDLVNVSQILSVYLGKGNGTFEDEMDCGVLTGVWEQVVIADLNRDGHLDVAGGMIEAGIGVLAGMGGCQFQPMTEYPFPSRFPHGGEIVGLTYADVDGDGLGDLVARSVQGDVFLLHGGADGTFQVVPLSSGQPSCGGGCPPLVGEITGDGKVDVVVVGGTSGVGNPPTQVVRPTQILGNTCP